jgi:hypothetical protein
MSNAEMQEHLHYSNLDLSYIMSSIRHRQGDLVTFVKLKSPAPNPEISWLN